MWFCLGTETNAQSLTTILANGPKSNRVNVVVLSEGYRSDQASRFLADATNLVTTFLGTMPFQEYQDCFNAYAITVASVQSGSDHPKTLGPYRDTYFNSTYDSNLDYIITIPANALGQGKVDTLITNLLPEANLVMLLVNDIQPGGSAVVGNPGSTNSHRPVITALNSFFPYSGIAAHETAHLLAGLVDEYTNAVSGYTPVEAPNATQQSNRNLIKWRLWIDAATPIPTPKTSAYGGVVGLFEGAQYQSAGWYRPKLNCRMGQNGLNYDFCEVCSEQIVKTIYQAVRPLDGLGPITSNVLVYGTQTVAFSTIPVQPRTHDLRIQWFTNNAPAAGATNLSFYLQPLELGNGTHSVRAVVQDATSLVRNDPARLLWATNTWSVTISLNQLQLVAPQPLSGGRFRLTITGTAPEGFVIQASTNLTDWVRLATNSLSGGSCDYTNTGLGGTPFRYYRTVSPP